MSEAVQYYVATLVVFGAVDVLACWGLNLQFGVAGVLNFAFVVLQAAGGYTAAVLTLGSSATTGDFQHYVFGAKLPFPIPTIIAGIVGALFAGMIGLVVLRRLRRDYQAMVMLVISLIATHVATNQRGLVNGDAGLVLIPKPLEMQLALDPVVYQWVYAGFCVVIAAVGFFIMQRMTRAPFGRTLRAIRDNEPVAAALGRNPLRFQLTAMMVGGVFAGVSGALLVQYIGAYGPGSWTYPVTFLYLTAILVGGTGNNVGVLLGAAVVASLINEGTRFLPEIGFPGLTGALQWIAVGLLTLAFLWFRPQGLIPERGLRRDKSGGPAPSAVATAGGR
jgi:branched-chain amino acid transport system permease protein